MEEYYFASDDALIKGVRVSKKFCSRAGSMLKTARTTEAGRNLAYCRWTPKRSRNRTYDGRYKGIKGISAIDDRLTDYEPSIGSAKVRVSKKFCSRAGSMLKTARTTEAGRNLAMCRWTPKRSRNRTYDGRYSSSKKKQC